MSMVDLKFEIQGSGQIGQTCTCIDNIGIASARTIANYILFLGGAILEQLFVYNVFICVF